MGQPVAMFEIISADHGRAQEFYSSLFGWSVDLMPDSGGYGLVDTNAGEGSVGGAIGPSMGGGDTGVKVYIRVDDLASALERASALGGATVVPPTELPTGYGSFAIFADPD